MNLIRCLVEAFNPCVHQDRVVATMYDNKDDPKVTTVVSTCEICGRTKEETFRASGVCFHQWETLRRKDVFDNETDKRPVYARVEQRCKKCGTERAVNLIPEDSIRHAKNRGRKAA